MYGHDRSGYGSYWEPSKEISNPFNIQRLAQNTMVPYNMETTAPQIPLPVAPMITYADHHTPPGEGFSSSSEPKSSMTIDRVLSVIVIILFIILIVLTIVQISTQKRMPMSDQYIQYNNRIIKKMMKKMDKIKMGTKMRR